MQIQKLKKYGAFLGEIKARIQTAQWQALQSVNQELVHLYWDIGKMIVVRQKTEGWGKSIVEQLAADLQKEFPGITGFSARNIWYMRDFYVCYGKNEKLQPLVAEIGWTHNLIILSRCKDSLEREFYIRMTRKMGWSKNVLIQKIEGKTYQATLSNQTNFKSTLPEKIHDQAALAVKDEYLFDFLGLGEEHNETQLEQALLGKINRFLVEMGGTFTFAGNQFRLEVGGQEFFIDILLYHRRLKCFVAIELKVGEFKPEHAGKMQFYLAALDDLIKSKGENPSIGIILCKEKNRTIVEYTLRSTNKPIGVSEYQTVRKLPKKLKTELPTPESIQKLFDSL